MPSLTAGEIELRPDGVARFPARDPGKPDMLRGQDVREQRQPLLLGSRAVTQGLKDFPIGPRHRPQHSLEMRFHESPSFPAHLFRRLTGQIDVTLNPSSRHRKTKLSGRDPGLIRRYPGAPRFDVALELRMLADLLEDFPIFRFHQGAAVLDADFAAALRLCLQELGDGTRQRLEFLERLPELLRGRGLEGTWVNRRRSSLNS